MPKKLTEEQMAGIIDTGIREFADKGYENANTNVIAKKAGVSVGYLFKTYGDKRGFFTACLEKSLQALTDAISSCDMAGKKPGEKARALIRTTIEFSRAHDDYIRMYYEVTVLRDRDLTKEMADRIEGISAKAYAAIIEKGQQEGILRKDLPAKKAAYLFDNIMMMLQFSFAGDYYKERYRVYTGLEPDDPAGDEALIGQVMDFLRAALGAESVKKAERKVNSKATNPA